MSDLMPCQMCGGAATQWTNSQVSCCDCGISGMRINSQTPGSLSFNFSDYMRVSAEGWNEMQRLIARGKLLDESPTKKGGRL